jgi:hypothetical protein
VRADLKRVDHGVDHDGTRWSRWVVTAVYDTAFWEEGFWDYAQALDFLVRLLRVTT